MKYLSVSSRETVVTLFKNKENTLLPPIISALKSIKTDYTWQN